MLKDDVPTKVVNLLRAHFENTLINVRIYMLRTELFEIAYDVRQGCPESPILFSYIVNWIMNNTLKEDDGVAFSAQQKIADVEHADDGTLLTDSAQTAQNMIERVVKMASEIELVINIPKTKYL
ncbi:hypothetical protein QYM36_008102 [Artemia franciscana]|uniref:Reverse transcriptase domain-containing protein n=1 Tax=Artemia franciscana TaxID=6661 RepID=A0AA88IIF3_ARTSF|nr:hypothetical protein QYM36_008102 [Artemia franciscana]